MGSMLGKVIGSLEIDVVLSFLVNGGMIVPKVPDTLGESITWLKCEIFFVL